MLLPASPLPRRTRRKRKRRGQGPPRPAPGRVPEPGTMDLSLEEPSDARLLHTFREVWEDTLTWEEIRARKVDMSGFDPSQVPASTPVLFSETQSDVSSSSPTLLLDSPVPSTFSSDGSVVASVAMTPVPDYFTRSPGAMSISLIGLPDANGVFDFGRRTERILDGVSLERFRVHDYEDLPDLRPSFAVPTEPPIVLPDVPPARFPAPPDVPP